MQHRSVFTGLSRQQGQQTVQRPPAPAYFSLSYEHCDVCGNAAPSSSRRPLRTSPTTRPRRSATRSRRRCSSCTRTTSLLGRRDRSSSSAKRTFLPSVFRSSQRPSMSPSPLGGVRVQRRPPPPTTTAYTATVCLTLSCFPIDTGKDVRTRLVFVCM